MEGLHADIDMLKADMAQGLGRVRSAPDGSAASTGSWERIRVEEASPWKRNGPPGQQQARVSMLPEGILQSAPMTQNGPGFNAKLGSRNDEEGGSVLGAGSGQRAIPINVCSTQTVTQTQNTEAKPGRLHATLSS